MKMFKPSLYPELRDIQIRYRQIPLLRRELLSLHRRHAHGGLLLVLILSTHRTSYSDGHDQRRRSTRTWGGMTDRSLDTRTIDTSYVLDRSWSCISRTSWNMQRMGVWRSDSIVYSIIPISDVDDDAGDDLKSADLSDAVLSQRRESPTLLASLRSIVHLTPPFDLWRSQFGRLEKTLTLGADHDDDDGEC